MENAFSLVMYLLIFGPCWFYAFFWLFQKCRSVQCCACRCKRGTASVEADDGEHSHRSSVTEGAVAQERPESCELSWGVDGRVELYLYRYPAAIICELTGTAYQWAPLEMPHRCFYKYEHERHYRWCVLFCGLDFIGLAHSE